MAAPHKKPRVFIDSNVLLAGNAFPRWPYEVLEHAIDGDFQLVLCPLVIKQAREHLQKLFPTHLARFEKLLREADYELVPDPTPDEVDTHPNLVRDSSDVPVALAAIAIVYPAFASLAQDNGRKHTLSEYCASLAGTFP